MRKLLAMSALMCLVALHNLSAAPDKADKTDQDKLQGEWVVSIIEFAGDKVDIPKDMETVFAFKDDKVTRKQGTKSEEGPFKLDEKKKVKEIDLPKPGEEKEKITLKAIYEIDGDTLKIGIPLDPNAARPTGMDSKEIAVVTLKRKK